jgi:hypothetical protein
MKRITALSTVTAIAALSFAGQAFAKGGGMGGGQGHGSTSGTHQMPSTMPSASGYGMQERTMHSNAFQHGPADRSGPHNMRQGGSGNSVSHRNGQMPGNGTDPDTERTPVTTATN